MSTPSRRALSLRDDAGTTVLEMMVAMVLMTVFMGIFTTAVVSITRSTLKVEGIADSVEQGNTAFLGLERSIRYASAMSKPDRTSPGGIWHVEFADRDDTGAARCTQLRVRDRLLQRRTWTPQGSSYTSGTLTGWKTLAANVTNGGVSDDAPFQTPDIQGATTSYKRLKVVLLIAGSAGNTASTHRSETTYTALNSADSSSSVCDQSTVGTP